MADKPKTVHPEDVHIPVVDVLANALSDAREGAYATVVVAAIDMNGDVALASSTGSPQTINLLAQAIEVADGEKEPADPIE